MKPLQRGGPQPSTSRSGDVSARYAPTRGDDAGRRGGGGRPRGAGLDRGYAEDHGSPGGQRCHGRRHVRCGVCAQPVVAMVCVLSFLWYDAHKAAQSRRASGARRCRRSLRRTRAENILRRRAVPRAVRVLRLGRVVSMLGNVRLGRPLAFARYCDAGLWRSSSVRGCNVAHRVPHMY